MTAEQGLLFWWAAFALSHLLLTSQRQKLIAAMGGTAYSLIFTVIAFACFIPLVMLYLDHRHQGGLLLTLPSWVGQLGIVLSVLGITGVIASLFQPSPTGAMPSGHQLSHGLTRITRHPMFMFLGIWGLGHCLLNPFMTDVLFFAGFPVFAIIGCAHQDHRKRHAQGERLEQFFAETSLLPFVAILSGRNKMATSELPWFAILLGLAISYGLYRLHAWMLA